MKKIKTELSGYVSGFLGMLGFSLTLPATRIAVSELDPVFVGLGRAVVAAGLSIIVLLITRQSFPSKRFGVAESRYDFIISQTNQINQKAKS